MFALCTHYTALDNNCQILSTETQLCIFAVFDFTLQIIIIEHILIFPSLFYQNIYSIIL